MRPKKRLWEQISVRLVVVSSQEKEAAICEELGGGLAKLHLY